MNTQILEKKSQLKKIALSTFVRSFCTFSLLNNNGKRDEGIFTVYHKFAFWLKRSLI